MKLRAVWALLLLLMLALVGVGIFFHALYQTQIQHVVRQNTVALDVAYRSTISMYRLDVETRFKRQVLRDDVLALLQQANDATPAQLPLIRGRLYRALRGDYEDMVKAGLRQLHFHFPDGRSLLRFHSPAHMNDASMFDIRPSIRIANTELRTTVGFEGGRILPGFRNVFPIIHAGRHLGSVELSLPFELIHQNLINLLPRGDYALLLHRDVVGMTFKDQRDKFVPADLHPDYFNENPEISRVSREFVLSDQGRLLNRLLRVDVEVQTAMSSGATFSVPVLHDGLGYIASFHAIDDLQGRHAAYVIGYSEAPVLVGIRDAVLRQAAIVCALLILLALAVDFLIRQRHRLADEKQRLHTITEAMSDGLYVIDAQGRTVFINQTACDLTGYRKDELLGQVAHDLFHLHADTGGTPSAECPIIQAAQRGSEFHGEEWFTARDRRVYPVEVSCRPLLEGSKPVGAVILFRDISAARASMEHMRLQSAALDASANAIVITDIDARVEWANPAFSALTGYTLADAAGKTPRELVYSGMQDSAFFADMWQTILSGLPWQGELVNRKKNGELYDEAMNIAPVQDAQGAIQHFIAIKQDISKRKQIEAAAAQAKAEIERLSARNELLLNSAGDGIFGVDPQGLCIFINPAALAMLGYAREEAVGQDLHVLFHHHHGDGLAYPHEECPIIQTQGDGLRRNVEDVFIRKSGDYFDVHLMVTPIVEADAVHGVVVVFQDITERKRMEHELQRLATTDTLTGIANRRHFLRQLGVELERVQRYGKPASLLMLDLDHFKLINDRHGHAAGDRVLRWFAELTQSCLRRVDLFGRLGGEEFSVLLPDTGLAGAREIAERLRALIEQKPCPDPAQDIAFTVSIGVAACSDCGLDADSILARADRALYQAKNAGRNRVVVDDAL